MCVLLWVYLLIFAPLRVCGHRGLAEVDAWEAKHSSGKYSSVATKVEALQSDALEFDEIVGYKWSLALYRAVKKSEPKDMLCVQGPQPTIRMQIHCAKNPPGVFWLRGAPT